MCLELSDPVAHAVEALFGCAIVCEYDAVGLVEVLHGHRAEAFLSGRVPHEQLHVLAIDLDVLDLEVDAYRGDVLRRETVI